jgi:asparagine synthase (glutamine-hydrolysing)
MTRQANLPPGLAGRVDTRARLARLADSIASSHVRSTDGRAATSIGSPFTTVGVERYGRVAAARGIEPRHAFLDRELVDFATWIPPGLLLRDGYPKWALRTAMAGQLPPDVTWRRGKEHLGWRFNLARYRLMAERMGIKPAASTADWEASLMSLARKQLCL